MAYPAKTWAKIKTEYHSGISAEKLSGKYQVSAVAIHQRAQREQWGKGSLKPIIEKTIQEKYLAALKKVGVDEMRIAGTLDKMLAATKPTIVKGFGEERESVSQEGSPQGFVAEVEDWVARDKAVTQVAKLTGAYAAEKQDITGLPMPPGILEIIIKRDA